MAIVVGCRVTTKKATAFRIWATNVLREYIQGIRNERRTFEEPLQNSCQNCLRHETVALPDLQVRGFGLRANGLTERPPEWCTVVHRTAFF